MLSIHLNGEKQGLERPLSLQEILEQFEIRREAVAVAVNAEVIPRSELSKTKVRDGDRIEIIHAVGGG